MHVIKFLFASTFDILFIRKLEMQQKWVSNSVLLKSLIFLDLGCIDVSVMILFSVFFYSFRHTGTKMLQFNHLMAYVIAIAQLNKSTVVNKLMIDMNENQLLQKSSIFHSYNQITQFMK